jgi:hypothetical protein
LLPLAWPPPLAAVSAWLPLVGGAAGVAAVAAVAIVTARDAPLRRALRQVADQQRSTSPFQLAETLERLSRLEQTLSDLRDGATRHLPAPGFVRFAAYSAGDPPLSFSLALVDGRGDGLVVTSLQGRDHARLYAKVLRAGEPETALSPEELEAVRQARAGLAGTSPPAGLPRRAQRSGRA